MRKKKSLVKFLAVSSAFVLGITNCMYPVNAEQNQQQTKLDYIKGRKLTEDEVNKMKSFEPKNLTTFKNDFQVPIYKKLPSKKVTADMARRNAMQATYIPSSYSSVERGNVTPVKNQGQWGTCWAHGCLNSLESSMVMQGINYKGQPANVNTCDLSEWQLAYFAYNTVADPLHNTDGDSTVITDNDYLSFGGWAEAAMFELASWVGAKTEETAPYDIIDCYGNIYNLDRWQLDDSLAYNPDVKLKDALQISFANRDIVKQMIIDNGSGAVSYLWNSDYFNYDTAAEYNPETPGTNHLVSVVGWDDNYSRTNFLTQPDHDGAWLVKNSWGTSWGNDGYFWLSYDDCAVKSDSYSYATFFIAQDENTYDNNYQYDGSLGRSFYFLSDGQQVANRFTVPYDSKGETLKAISFAADTANLQYTIQVYKNWDRTNPTSGVAQFDQPQVGTVDYAGYHTIPLDKYVDLYAGDSFSIVMTFKSLQDDYSVQLYSDWSMEHTFDNGTITYTSTSKEGESFVFDTYDNIWRDLHTEYSCENLRIKAFTEDKVKKTTSPKPSFTTKPYVEPTWQPTYQPTYEPTWQPTYEPSPSPTWQPTWQPTYEPTYEPTPSPSEEPVLNIFTHNFTTDGLNSDVFSITGNLGHQRDTVVYNGITLTQYLKMESLTNVSFSIPSNGTITLICDEQSNGCGIKIDDQRYAVQDGHLIVELGAGNHTIKKSNKNVVIYYMVLEHE